MSQNQNVKPGQVTELTDAELSAVAGGDGDAKPSNTGGTLTTLDSSSSKHTKNSISESSSGVSGSGTPVSSFGFPT